VRSPRKGTANPRTYSIIPQAVFQGLSCPTGGLHWVRRRQRLIAAIYSSSEDSFTLFSITTKQPIALKPCQTFYKQRWLAYCPTLVISPDLGLRGSSWKIRILPREHISGMSLNRCLEQELFAILTCRNMNCIVKYQSPIRYQFQYQIVLMSMFFCCAI